MGASGMGGGKKSSNFELNLVPFIDLLSTLICFLLLTAAWQQLSTIGTNTAPTTPASPDTPPPEIQQPPEKKVTLSVTLWLDKIELSEDAELTVIPHLGGRDLDVERLKAALATWRGRYPDRKDLVLNTDSRAPYKHLIGLMDTFIANDWPDVGINLY